jgi:acetylornithine deacetylase
MTNAPDPIPLLADLVRAPSVSGREEPALDVLERWLAGAGVASERHGRNLVASAGAPGGACLLLNAHIDTVPAGPGWTRDPHGAGIEGDRLFGLGANDNKGSLAAMAAAFVALAAAPPPGRLLLAATADEETGGEGLEWLRPRLGTLSAALLSEPTDFRVAVAQRGLVRLTARVKGRTSHASRPWEGRNAIHLALEDLGRLRRIDLSGEHPLLGRATLEVTKVSGGTAANMLPGECVFTVDGRPTPEHPNEEYEREIRAALVHSGIEALKTRMCPVVCPSDSAVVRAALEATGTDAPAALGGVSDLFFVRDLPAAVVGPGTPDQSHAPDESVSVTAVRRAVRVYRQIAERTLVEIAE